MDKFEYEQLLKESIKAQTTSVELTKAMQDCLCDIKDNLAKVNDNQALHNGLVMDIGKDMKAIKLELLKWIKVLLVLLFVTIGGATMFDKYKEIIFKIF